MESNDIYQQKLDTQKRLLEECQASKEIDSCLKCQEILECEIRDNYIKSVYASMNKGESGGFEF